MANTARAQGFQPYGKMLRANKYQAGSTVYMGDLVSMADDGQCDTSAAGVTLLGVALNYATVGQDLMVCDDPNQLYVVMASASEVDAQTDIGNNADHVATAPNAVYKSSRQRLNTGALVTSSAGLTILGIEPKIDNAFGASVQVIVKINEHQIAGVDAFAGI